MKITDVTLTLFAWDNIPATTYGQHTARPTGKSDLGLLRLVDRRGDRGAMPFSAPRRTRRASTGRASSDFLKPIVWDRTRSTASG